MYCMFREDIRGQLALRPDIVRVLSKSYCFVRFYYFHEICYLLVDVMTDLYFALL